MGQEDTNMEIVMMVDNTGRKRRESDMARGWRRLVLVATGRLGRYLRGDRGTG